MKPLSLDLRQKIVEAYTNGEGSLRELARRFKVSLSFIQRLIKKYTNTGNIEPLPVGGGPTPQLDSYKDKIFQYLGSWQRSELRATLRYFRAIYSGQGQYCALCVVFYRSTNSAAKKKPLMLPKLILMSCN